MRDQSGGCPWEGLEGAEGLLGAGRAVLLGPLLASLVGSLCERPPSRSPTVCDLAVVPQALLDPVSASVCLAGQALTQILSTPGVDQAHHTDEQTEAERGLCPRAASWTGADPQCPSDCPPPVPFPRHITPTSAVLLTRLGLAVLQCRVSPAPG